jgi:very-short-patch-repair endonuclease
MGHQIDQEIADSAWRLAKRQHGVLTRTQLLNLGLSTEAIKHRITTRRLHPVAAGVYAVGRPMLTQHGRWMAAVLSCGPTAALSHHSAAALWEICVLPTSAIHVSVLGTVRRRPGLVVHRRAALTSKAITRRKGIPVTSPTCTLIDLAHSVEANRIERAIDVADNLDLVTPDRLREALGETRQPGVRVLRRILDRRTFVLTDSELERRFLPLARRAGLAKPHTRLYVNGFKVDFFWPELGLVVETDSLRYHRTPVQQARDRLSDQTHTASGLTAVRFSHGQIRYEPDHVCTILRRVAERL